MADSWQQFKAQGNSAYTGGNTEAAVEAYSKALGFADVPPADRATILCNRAQCYLKLNDNAAAVEDCTACLTISATNVKALFRRAVAFEALGEKKEALDDYRKVLTIDAGVSDAIAGVRRLEASLGETSTLAAGASKKTKGGGAVAGRVTPEDARQLDETKQRVKDVALQKVKTQDQAATSKREKRQLELTLGQVETLPADVRTFTPVGKAFLLIPRAELKSQLTDKLARTETKLKVCASALEHIERQEKEADAAFMEVVEGIRRKNAKGGAAY